MKSRIWVLSMVLTTALAFLGLTVPVVLSAPPRPTRDPHPDPTVGPPETRVPDPTPGPNSRPEATNTLQITNRTPTAITLKWHDRSDIEDGNKLFRHTSQESFDRDAVQVADLGSLNTSDGWVVYTDTVNVGHNSPYCYQVRPYNAHGSSKSNIACASCARRNDVEGPSGRITRLDADYLVSTRVQLLAALATASDGEVVYIDDSANINLTRDADIDFTDLPVNVPAGVTLASGRGLDGLPGARLYTRDAEIRPMIRVRGCNVRITGIRIEGPSQSTSAAPKAEGIGSRNGHDYLEIDNCELYGWTREAIRIVGYSHLNRVTASRIHIHDNYIHHNLANGFGYGIMVGDAYALIEKNIFDYNRHAIAGTGVGGSGYIARYNLVLEGGKKYAYSIVTELFPVYEHSFDMHRSGPDDCCGPAGQFIHVYENSFQFGKKYAVKIRGRPEMPSTVENNAFIHSDIGDAVRQTNEKGNLAVANNITGYDSRGQYGVGDFNGDGRDDLFQAAGRSFFYSSGGSFVWRHMLNSGERLAEIGFGDFNGDGRTDLLRALKSRWEVSWSGTSEWKHLNNSGIGLEQLGFGDFDGNGRTDIFKTSGGKWYVSWNGTSKWGDPINDLGYSVDKLRFGDFGDGNCDGRTDVFKTSGGKWYVSWNGTSKWGDPINDLGYSIDKLRFGDFNGDGCTDVFRSEDGKWYYSSGGTSEWIQLHGADWSLSKIIIADFTGDGKDDIARRKSRRLWVSPSGEETPYILNPDFLL